MTTTTQMKENILEKLTPELLSLSTGCSLDIANKFCPYLVAILPTFEITTLNRLAAFLAQTSHETAGFTKLEENLNYSADGLANTWPNRYASRSSQNGLYDKNKVGRYLPNPLALKLARKPLNIANNVYANRMGNGNEASGDGWKYRGKGLIQLTGKANHVMLTLNTGIDFIKEPDLLLQACFAVISAGWFWKENNLNQLADKEDIEGISKTINGGSIGLSKRLELYAKIKSKLK